MFHPHDGWPQREIKHCYMLQCEEHSNTVLVKEARPSTWFHSVERPEHTDTQRQARSVPDRSWTSWGKWRVTADGNRFSSRVIKML